MAWPWGEGHAARSILPPPPLPPNTLLQVVDFGLSRIIGNETYLRTRTLGCAEYM